MKIAIIGCPGSGKSTLARALNKKLNYPLMYMDKVYHITNNEHITREELKQKVDEFARVNKNWIIDGNYMDSLEQRINLADTIILMDIDTDICVKNVYKRAKSPRQEDMADGFDLSIMEDYFIEFVTNFKTQSLPVLEELLSKTKNKRIIRITNYNQIDDVIKNI